MAWTAPKTWVASEFVDASEMNQHVRDNLNYLNDLRIEYVSGSSDVTNITTTERTLLTLPAYTPISSNRVLRLSYHCRGIGHDGVDANGIWLFKIQEGTTVITESHYTPSRSTTASMGTDLWCLVVSPSATSHTYKTTVAKTSGSGSAVIGAGTNPQWMTLEDIGAA